MNRKHRKHKRIHPHGDELTLDKIKPDQEIIVKSVKGGWHIRQRLDQLGIYVGIKATVSRGGPFGGPILLSTSQSTVALGRGMAAHIIVDYVEQS